jgi:hypothetical protein
MDLHRFWDGVITSSQNLTRPRNEATALRSRQEFQRSQLTELANTDFESWAKESFEIATKFAYRNGGRIGIPKGGAIDCTMVAAAPVLPPGYVVSASRIADRRMILAGYRLADLLTRILKLLIDFDSPSNANVSVFFRCRPEAKYWAMKIAVSLSSSASTASQYLNEFVYAALTLNSATGSSNPLSISGFSCSKENPFPATSWRTTSDTST